jgi:hypothetical protein
VAFVVVDAALHRRYRNIGDFADNEISSVAFSLRNRKVRDDGIRERNPIFEIVREGSEP